MKKIKKEIIRFIFAGVSAVLTDFTAYYVFLFYLNNDISKGFSFILGTIVAFTINKYWTFEKFKRSTKEIIKFIILYSSTLVINVLVNKTILEINNTVLLAFICATATSAILNFTGQKFWVFK